MSAYTWASQQALVKALRTAGLPCGQRVYDDAPQSVEFPWLEIGDRQVVPDDTTAPNGGSDDGVSDFFDLHGWSRAKGKQEVMEMVDGIHALLHGRSLTIPGRSSALSWVRSARVFRDPDAITRHAIISVEIIHRT